MRTPPTLPTDTGNGRLEYAAKGAVYWISPTGDRWRVHDCVMKDGVLARVPMESEDATFRVFVAETGVKKLYRRQPRELWTLTPARCERQLSAAEFLGVLPTFDSTHRTAR